MFYQDKNLTCADCGAEFVFTAGEQEFHASKGFSSEPRRCRDCRSARKATGGGGGGGGSYSSGGGGGFGGPRGGAGGGTREMFDAVCAECGRDTQVPFRPSGTRPVYCSDCFRQSGGGGGGGSRGGGGGSRGGGGGRDRW